MSCTSQNKNVKTKTNSVRQTLEHLTPLFIKVKKQTEFSCERTEIQYYKKTTPHRTIQLVLIHCERGFKMSEAVSLRQTNMLFTTNKTISKIKCSGECKKKVCVCVCACMSVWMCVHA